MSRAHAGVLAAVCALAFFAGLGGTPLWEPDEPRFAVATREMTRSGDYLNPVFNGEPRWEKPILLYWLQATAMAVGLDGAWAMRLPAALAGALAVIGVFALGRLWWSARAGLVAAVTLATTFRFATYARQGLTDLPAVAGIVIAILAFELATSDPQRRRWAWWTGWIVVGATALLKGPLAIIAPAVWLPVHWAVNRTGASWRDVLSGAGLATAIGASWLIYMVARYGGDFVSLHLGYEIVQRFADPDFAGKPRGAFYYWRIFPGEIAPWTLLVLAAFTIVAVRYRELKAADRRPVLLAAVWFVGVMALCSASRYKLPHYTLPAYPAACLLLGFAIDSFAVAWSGRVLRIAAWATFGIVTCLGLALALVALEIPLQLGPGVFTVGFVLALGGALSIALSRSGLWRALASAAVTVSAAYGIAGVFVLPPLVALAYPYPEVGQLVAKHAPASTRLGSLDVHTALVYYADRDVDFMTSPQEVTAFLASEEPRLVTMAGQHLAAVTATLDPPPEVIARRRLRNPRLSHLRDGRFVNGSDDLLLVANVAAAREWGP